MAGLPGTGKSALSRALAAELGGTVIDKDHIRAALFDPPARLDRIEITQITQNSLAMGRFFARRGPSVYMCYVETGDIEALSGRLETLGARFEPFGDSMGLFIHPSALCGMLMGVSGTNVGWRWSGRPELAPEPR